MTTTTQLQHRHDNDAHASGTCCTAMHEEIALAAYHHFEKRGRKDGHDVRDWLQAETSVKARHRSQKHAHHEPHRHA